MRSPERSCGDEGDALDDGSMKRRLYMDASEKRNDVKWAPTRLVVVEYVDGVIAGQESGAGSVEQLGVCHGCDDYR